MATPNYTDLIDSLKSILRRGANQAIPFINSAEIALEEKQTILHAIGKHTFNFAGV